MQRDCFFYSAFYLLCTTILYYFGRLAIIYFSNEYFFCNVKIVGCIDVGLNLNQGVLLIIFFSYIFFRK